MTTTTPQKQKASSVLSERLQHQFLELHSELDSLLAKLEKEIKVSRKEAQ